MKVLGERKEQYKTLRPVSTSANSVARTGTIACSNIEKKKSDWLSLILVAIKLNFGDGLSITYKVTCPKERQRQIIIYPDTR